MYFMKGSVRMQMGIISVGGRNLCHLRTVLAVFVGHEDRGTPKKLEGGKRQLGHGGSRGQFFRSTTLDRKGSRGQPEKNLHQCLANPMNGFTINLHAMISHTNQ